MARVIRSKKEYRQRLAALPIEQKLKMLDALRARTLEIQSASPATGSRRLPMRGRKTGKMR